MDFKKFSISLIASFVVMFLIAFVWHVHIMGEFMKEHSGALGDIDRSEPLVPYIALGYFILAAVMSYLYPKGIEGDNKMKNGMMFGMVIGILWVLPHSVVMYGASEIASRTNILVDGLWHIVEQGIGGMIIAMVYGIPGSESSSADTTASSSAQTTEPAAAATAKTSTTETKESSSADGGES